MIGEFERIVWPLYLVGFWVVALATHATLLLVALGLWTGALGLVKLGRLTGDGSRFLSLARVLAVLAVILAAVFLKFH